MRSLWMLYLSYLKTAGLTMLWATVLFTAYAIIRTSAIAAAIVAGAVSVVLSLAVVLPLLDYLSPSHRIRRAAAAALALLVALLARSSARPEHKQGA